MIYTWEQTLKVREHVHLTYIWLNTAGLLFLNGLTNLHFHQKLMTFSPHLSQHFLLLTLKIVISLMCMNQHIIIWACIYVVVSFTSSSTCQTFWLPFLFWPKFFVHFSTHLPNSFLLYLQEFTVCTIGLYLSIIRHYKYFLSFCYLLISCIFPLRNKQY